jgi:hypothetical protein
MMNYYDLSAYAAARFELTRYVVVIWDMWLTTNGLTSYQLTTVIELIQLTQQLSLGLTLLGGGLLCYLG